MLAIKGAKTWTLGSRGTLDSCVILIDGERISAVESRMDIPAEAEVIDATRLTIVPGFVDAHSHLGLASNGLAVDDGTEYTEQVTPHLMALDALDPISQSLKTSLMGGVTTSALLPGAAMSFGPITENITVMPGMASVLKIKQTYPEVLREKAGIKMAFGNHPKRAVEEKKTAPVTRMNIVAMVRESLRGAQTYAAKKAKGDEAVDLKKEALLGLLESRYPAHVHVHKLRDIELVLSVAEEFGFKVVLHHVTEGHLAADMLAEKQIPCAVGPIAFTRRGTELANLNLATPGILSSAGAKVAIVSDFPTFPAHYLPIHAGMACREGMKYEDALSAITLSAAQILEVDDEVGSLEPGKYADLVAFEGDPLQAMSKVRLVLASGNIIRDSIRTKGGVV